MSICGDTEIHLYFFSLLFFEHPCASYHHNVLYFHHQISHFKLGSLCRIQHFMNLIHVWITNFSKSIYNHIEISLVIFSISSWWKWLLIMTNHGIPRKFSCQCHTILANRRRQRERLSGIIIYTCKKLYVSNQLTSQCCQHT